MNRKSEKAETHEGPTARFLAEVDTLIEEARDGSTPPAELIARLDDLQAEHKRRVRGFRPKGRELTNYLHELQRKELSEAIRARGKQES